MPRKTIGVKFALKPSYSELATECAALKKENAKLHKRIVKLEAQNLSANNRIVALEQHLKEIEHHRTPSEGKGVRSCILLFPTFLIVPMDHASSS